MSLKIIYPLIWILLFLVSLSQLGCGCGPSTSGVVVRKEHNLARTTTEEVKDMDTNAVVVKTVKHPETWILTIKNRCSSNFIRHSVSEMEYDMVRIGDQYDTAK